MAKAEPLTPAALSTPQITPKAATPPRMPKAVASDVQVKRTQVPLQIRIPRQDARAIKIAAAEGEQTISDFMLACFHAYMHGRNRG